MTWGVVEDSLDKQRRMLDDFFDGKVHSFRACYAEITGDPRVTGMARDAVKLRASIESGTFSEILGDAVNRRMVKEYNASGLSDWRKITGPPVPLNDFRVQHRVRMGGYGDLPIVEESGSYDPLSTPGDEEATYSPAKRGGTEIITFESVKNDDVGVIRKVPVKLARSAAWTLYKFVFDSLKDNPVIYDGVNLFHATHANLGSAALDAAALKAGRLAMMKQSIAASGEGIGIPPRIIIVPTDLEDAAYELTAKPNLAGFTPTAADAIRRQTWEIIGVKHWLDTDDWYLSSDPGDVQGMEIGFLDGKEDPEIFVQDNPNMGSLFSHDIITYKIRHVYGKVITDFRAFYGARVG